MPGLLLVNPRSGSGSPDAEELAAEARRRGIAARILRAGEDAAELARAAEAGPVGIAGGDGSLGTVAAVAIERDVPFVCVPFGTRNHFARDLGLDRRDPIATLAAFADGRERRVDVGRAGERVFLNNVSLGVYARLVHRSKRYARLRALWQTLQNPRHLHVTIDGRPLEARVVLVANNAYELDPFSLGARARLDTGRLHLYAAHGIVRSTWDERSAKRFVLDVPAHRVRAAVDGEPVELETPIEVRIEPRALRVLLPNELP
jgi:diacylglycerol kinase family enzyme